MQCSHSTITRRQYLLGLCSGGVVALAGCSGDGDTNGTENGDDGTGDGQDSTDDGGDGTRDANDGSDDSSDDDSEDGTEDTDETEDSDEVDVTPSTPSSLAFEMESSFELDGETMESESEGYVDEEGNWYMFEVTEFEDGTVFEEEYVSIDDQLYAVDEFGDCQRFDGMSIDTTPAVEQEATTALLETATSLGQTTFEGTEVIEYELDPAAAAERYEGTDSDSVEEFSGLMYVARDTGFVVGGEFSVVSEDSTLNSRYHHHSFGEDFEVEVPEEC